MKKCALVLAGLLICLPALAEEPVPEDIYDPVTSTEVIDIPDEVRPFVPADYNPIMLEKGDVDGNGQKDYVLIIEKKISQFMDMEQRPLLVITRSDDKSLKLAARGDKAVFCSTCGGVFGDPLASLEADKGGFTVNLYGGSGWRWGYDFTFEYAPADKDWLLARSFETSFHAAAPDESDDKTYTPKDFGRITLKDFDAETYRKQDE